MRVSKSVREYINKQVEAKIAPKYEAERLESKRIKDIKNDIINRANAAAKDAARQILAEAAKHGDILNFKPDRLEDIYLSTPWNLIEVKEGEYTSSVHNWDTRKRKEVEAKVEDIIVTLELGGTKADLDRMLSEI